jgi:hypothetical protein
VIMSDSNVERRSGIGDEKWTEPQPPFRCEDPLLDRLGKPSGQLQAQKETELCTG